MFEIQIPLSYISGKEEIIKKGLSLSLFNAIEMTSFCTKRHLLNTNKKKNTLDVWAFQSGFLHNF